MDEDLTGAEPVEDQEADSETGIGDDPLAGPADDLVLATAHRIIASDAAIIHRLGTI